MLLASMVAAIALVFGGMLFVAYAEASEAEHEPLPTGYVTIDGIKVSRAIGIEASEELDEFLMSSVPKSITFDPATAKFVTVDLGNEEEGVSAEEAKEMMDGGADAGRIAHRSAVETAAEAKQSVLLQQDESTVGFDSPGTYDGRWTGVSHFTTGNHSVNVEYVFRGMRLETGFCDPGSTIVPIYGHPLDVVAVHVR